MYHEILECRVGKWHFLKVVDPRLFADFVGTEEISRSACQVILLGRGRLVSRQAVFRPIFVRTTKTASPRDAR